jgi:hydrogenase nickel incorporation protein HypA/HybF
MHELSIAIAIIEQIEQIEQIAVESNSRGGLAVEVVNLRLGVFSGVDREALLFAWELACEGTPLAGSRLAIETIPLLIYCPNCKTERTPVSVYQLCCPECLVPAQDILTGREIEVASLEVAA